MFHLQGRHVHRVQQRRASEGVGVQHVPVEFPGIVREGHGELRAVVKFDQKEFILRIGGLKESGRASDERRILLRMLPLVSSNTPIEMGASSLAK